MQPNAAVSPKQAPFPLLAILRRGLVHGLALGFIGGLYLVLPLLPLLCGLLFLRMDYILNYRTSLKKARIHIQGISEGPLHHYLHDVAGRRSAIPAEIRGECTQCGNCCMDKRCAFLEATDDGRYLCGIYSSPLRRMSNCRSFPISAHDIERYACPGYTVAQEAPIHWMPRNP